MEKSINQHKVYFKNLDALRAIAALSVICFHIGEWLPHPKSVLISNLTQLLSFNERGGELGVHFFFILSGFLITYLIYSEKKVSGSFQLFKFYLRRALRIWPLYYFTLIIGFFIFPFFIDDAKEGSSLLMYSLYLANFDNATHPANNGLLGVQWSVAIEEQFYLFWPLIMMVQKRFFLPLILLLIIFSEAFYFFNPAWEIRYLHTISNCRFLFMGGLIAHLSFYNHNLIIKYLDKLNPLGGIIIYSTSLLILFFQYQTSLMIPAIKPILHFLSLVFFSYVILDQSFSTKPWMNLGRITVLNQLGKVSYGLYLLHMVIIYPLSKFEFPNPWLYICIYILVILTTIILSKITFLLIESPFLKMKKKLSLIQKE